MSGLNIRSRRCSQCSESVSGGLSTRGFFSSLCFWSDGAPFSKWVTLDRCSSSSSEWWSKAERLLERFGLGLRLVAPLEKENLRPEGGVAGAEALCDPRWVIIW
jgi:hypothetical protein